jgi:ribosomal protein S18 acetylase RimI-like enzyme
MAGRAVVELLLGTKPACDEISRHDDMIVAHLALQSISDEAKDPATSIAEALAERPQVVVIDEDITMGGDTWARAFCEILHGNEIPNFQGAIVICCNDETHMAQRHCSTRWVATGSLLRPEDVCQGAKIFDDVLATDSDTSLPPLLDEVTDLWKSCFGDFEKVHWKGDAEPDMDTLAQEKGWKVALLANEKSDSDPDMALDADSTSDASSDSDSQSQLLGFLAYNTFPGIGELHILRLAVPKVHRRQGYGTQLIRWACAKTSSLGLESVWLYATPDVEDFYERVGFLNMGYMHDPSLCPEVDDSERYSWMMLDVKEQFLKHGNARGAEGGL